MTLKQRAGRWIYAHLPIDRRCFESLRREMRFLWERLLNAILPWRRAKIARLRLLRGVSLNVGSGGMGRAGWINFDASPHHDFIYCRYDIRRPLPFADCSVRRIFAEHIIEHLDYHEDLPHVLAEFHRVLEPAGKVRLIVPDAGRYLKAYACGQREAWRELGLDLDHLPGRTLTPMEFINHVFHQGGEHYFGWDFATMEVMLNRAGFSRVEHQSFGVSLDPELAIDQPLHASYSLYVDAVK